VSESEQGTVLELASAVAIESEVGTVPEELVSESEQDTVLELASAVAIGSE